MARKIEDQFTTTANVDAVRDYYGDDDDAVFDFYCGKCDGSGRIAYYGHVEGGRCFECGGNDGHYTKTVGQLVAAAKRRDATAANKASKAAAERAELDAWKADNADLLARADAVGCVWYQNWRYAPHHDQVENLTTAVAEREARKATAQPVPTGKTTVTGTVVSWKTTANKFSYNGADILKIVVEDERGFRVFGTCPAKIVEAVNGNMDVLKGATVTFTATLEPSRDDELFGFFKRATKAGLLEDMEN